MEDLHNGSEEVLGKVGQQESNLRGDYETPKMNWRHCAFVKYAYLEMLTMDARTCEDKFRELGTPVAPSRRTQVTTEDGVVDTPYLALGVKKAATRS